MRKTRFAETQIIAILKQHEGGKATNEIYTWFRLRKDGSTGKLPASPKTGLPRCYN